MEAHTARTLAHQVRQSNLGPYEQNALLTIITYAMRYSALIDVIATTEATNGNRDLLNELWQVCTYDVRADLVAAPDA